LHSTNNLLCQSIFIDTHIKRNLIECKANFISILDFYLRAQSEPDSNNLKNIITLNGHVLVYNMKIEIDRLSCYTIFNLAGVKSLLKAIFFSSFDYWRSG